MPGIWKFDYLFRMFRDNKRYHPFVVICPYSWFKDFDSDDIATTLRRTEQLMKDKGFEYVIPYDENKKKWLDVRKLYNPDIIFYTVPYKDMPPQYYIYKFRDKLTCYNHYGFSTTDLPVLSYKLPLHQILWTYFVETEKNMELGAEYAVSKGENMVVTGYVAADIYLDADYIPKDNWKRIEKPMKRIIWAPHHSFDDNLNIATFLEYHDFMLQLAQKYKDDVQFLFKPHHLLWFKLCKLWGEEKTAEYYRQWETMTNTQVELGEYSDWFFTSDAMIHDCCSFTSEYIYLNKPVLFLVKDANVIESKFNAVGIKSFHCHEQAHSEQDIERFVQNVINGIDNKKEMRSRHYNELLARDRRMPSQKIFDYIDNAISGNKK
ncbi:MAG: CDP-glycerol glycerophosphotransferase family protein [Bacteroidales bacterium]|nr:CDP-glycerol glycerophosphotransferase family protein [Bacteroidales bacterium]